MRLLGITNRYPPAGGGGYGEICADVMSALAQRGHEVSMLVGADPQVATELDTQVRISRSLAPVLAAWRRPLRALSAVRNDEAVLCRALGGRPDAVLVWHMRGLTKAPLRLVHDAGVPVLYMLHDRWMLYERPGSLLVPWPRLDHAGGAAVRELLTRLAPGKLELGAPPAERQGVVCFVSAWLAEQHAKRGWRPQDAHIVNCGVDVARFVPAHEIRNRTGAPSHRLLYAGRIERRKGLDVAVRALADVGAPLALTVAGGVDDPVYARRVMSDAQRLGVADRITWLGEVPRTHVIELLAEHDVLVYPSRTPEAYALGLVEGLAARMLVLTSATGGPLEYLEEGVNSLFFAPGDVAAMATQLRRLGDPDLCERLQRGAQATAERLSLGSIIDQVERLIAARLED